MKEHRYGLPPARVVEQLFALGHEDRAGNKSQEESYIGEESPQHMEGAMLARIKAMRKKNVKFMTNFTRKKLLLFVEEDFVQRICQLSEIWTLKLQYCN